MDDQNKQPLTEKQLYKKALKRGTRYRIPAFNTGVIIASCLLAAIIITCTAVILSRDSEDVPSPMDTEISTAVKETDTDDTKTVTVKMTVEDVHRGELILVNADHEYKFPESPTDVSVFDNKTLSYKVNDKNVTLSMEVITPFNQLMDAFYAEAGCRDVMVVSGFRTEEFQRQLYSDRVEAEGVEMAAKYVALPGQSEHHTGLAMDLSVYTDSGEGYYIRDYEKCKWLIDNFEKYGFVLRYPEDKASITGISYESWHYRFVGLPHSLIMKERGLCFEEYIEYLQNLGDGMVVTWDGFSSYEVQLTDTVTGYAVYYVPANADGDTVIALPKGREYTVSGDNVNGFIVTLEPMFGGNADE